MYLCVFEDELARRFLPLVYTRAVYDLRLGMHTLLEAQRRAFDPAATMLHTRSYVAAVTAEEHGLEVNRMPDSAGVLFVNGRWIVEEGDVLDRVRRAVSEPRTPRVFLHGESVLAAWVPNASRRHIEGNAVTAATFDGLPTEQVGNVRMLERLWDLQNELEDALRRDYALRTGGLYVYERPGVTISAGAYLEAAENIYIGPGSVVRAGAVLNAERGPIYIENDVVIKESAVIKGPIYIGSRSQIMSGADVECSAFGYCTKVGGQVSETIIHSLSNKAHAGYLGNSYVGRWCNLGADTNTSNLRNDYAETKMYDAVEEAFVPTGRTFLGLVMADHSKSGIGTMFNTAAVVGVSCNLYGAGFMPRHVPSFSWGTPDSLTEYRLEKALDVAEAAMQRRNRRLSDAEYENLRMVFEATRSEVVVS